LSLSPVSLKGPVFEVLVIPVKKTHLTPNESEVLILFQYSAFKKRKKNVKSVVFLPAYSLRPALWGGKDVASAQVIHAFIKYDISHLHKISGG
jgi:hypothetical protein